MDQSPREEFRKHAVDGNTITQRFQEFLEEHQRREENSSRALLEQRLARFRSEYIETMRETAMSFINIRQEVQGRGARFERFRDMVNAQLKHQLDGIQAEQINMEVRLTQPSQEHEQHSNDMGTSMARPHDAQEDLDGMVKTLARQVKDLQGETHPGSPQPENSASLVTNVEDLKSKTAHLIEHVDQHDRQLHVLTPLLQRAQEIEAQLEYWPSALPAVPSAVS